MKNSLIKDYIHIFKIPLLLVGILLVITLVCRFLFGKEEVNYVRGNDLCPQERVFDYADKLTAAEEEALRQKIVSAQEKTGCDIVVVILEESLEEYAKGYENQTGPLEPSQYTMVYANNFYDEHQFGFNEPLGDGILLLDNWYREADGGLYSWISPSGRVWEDYPASLVDRLMDAFIEEVQVDPYSGYALFVEMVEDELSPGGGSDFSFSWWMILLAGVAAAAIFFLVNFGGRKGKKTVGATTYVKSGRPDIRLKEDQFLNKTVTRRKIQTSSGSGGGGGGARISRGGGGRR